VIERIFGVLKRRFKVLHSAQEYPFATQAQTVAALAALHNFIITHDPSEMSLGEDETGPDEENAWSDHHAAVPREERTRAAKRRDNIAKAMWEEYLRRPARRRR
jgi:hypothetical protein